MAIYSPIHKMLFACLIFRRLSSVIGQVSLLTPWGSASLASAACQRDGRFFIPTEGLSGKALLSASIPAARGGGAQTRLVIEPADVRVDLNARDCGGDASFLVRLWLFQR